MFTGLVEDVGTIVAATTRGGGRQLTIRTAIPTDEIGLGDSVAVDGVCLTSEGTGPDTFVAVAGRETLTRTTLQDVRPGRRVHLERALRLGDRLGGHIVQGHVDGVGHVERQEDARESRVIWLRASDDLVRYVAPKGSLCIDGVSLTVNEVDGCRIRVNVVPHTLAVTRLGELVSGQPVNLEVDVLAKYVERLLEPGRGGGGLSLETLRRSGFA